MSAAALDAVLDQLCELVAAKLEQRFSRSPPPPPAQPQYIDIRRASARSGMSATWLRDAIRDGRLPAAKLGRSVRIAIADVDALLSSGPRAKASAGSSSPRDRAARIKIGGGR